MKIDDKETKEKELKEKIDQLRDKYIVRSFKTTTESLIFTKKMAQALSNIKVDLTNMKDADISEIFEFFDPELIKYTVETFVEIKDGEDLSPIDYESEFIGEFETIMIVFQMAIEKLMQKANGMGKPQVSPNQIKSNKRSLN